jgi:hypothetical protein
MSAGVALMITRLPESRAMRVVAATNRKRDRGKPGHSQTQGDSSEEVPE